MLVVTECTDPRLHRSRVEGRQRSIPGWYELNWPNVERAIATWQPVEDPTLVLDTAESLPQNVARLKQLLTLWFE